MGTSSSSTSINVNRFLYSIKLFNDDKVTEICSLSDLDLGVILRWVFDAQFEGAVKLPDIGQQKTRRLDGLETIMGQFSAFSMRYN